MGDNKGEKGNSVAAFVGCTRRLCVRVCIEQMTYLLQALLEQKYISERNG